ncbi:hypothetical protein INT44_005735 [Umbelopsis vinacea]|uniref:Uncharacterized protein n=1 Tax=Umbelopsis vinacea TaxID=44442 RepID=A0A8H7PZI4_9FUNG|nr:hypothetical protein INT44_005735 [Umbelopsis vinacea]
MFQKLVNFWVQSFVTERLLASKTFNAVAAKTHQHVSTITSKGQQTSNTFMKAFKENLEKERLNAKK